LADAAADAERVAGEVDVLDGGFVSVRRRIRQRLDESGIGPRIETIVGELV
jgi:hypothetical protein